MDVRREFYKYPVEVEDLLSRSFPDPGGAEAFRRTVESDVGVNRLGIDASREGGLSLRIQGQFFDFFWGMRAASLDNAIADHMDTIRWPDLLSTNACLSSGIACLSGPIWDRANRVTQACHLERIVPEARSPNWPYRRFDRSPLSVPLETTLGAPRRARRTTCERWQDRSVASDDRDPVADNPPY